MNDYEKMLKIEKWLETLPDSELKRINDKIHSTINRQFVIETILDHCKYDDELFEEFAEKSTR